MQRNKKDKKDTKNMKKSDKKDEEKLNKQQESTNGFPVLWSCVQIKLDGNIFVHEAPIL